MNDQRTIVAEVSKNWPNGDATPLAVLFERLIAANQARGYELDSWRLSQCFNGDGLVETIIAVFERTSRVEVEL